MHREIRGAAMGKGECGKAYGPLRCLVCCVRLCRVAGCKPTHLGTQRMRRVLTRAAPALSFAAHSISWSLVRSVALTWAMEGSPDEVNCMPRSSRTACKAGWCSPPLLRLKAAYPGPPRRLSVGVATHWRCSSHFPTSLLTSVLTPQIKALQTYAPTLYVIVRARLRRHGPLHCRLRLTWHGYRG